MKRRVAECIGCGDEKEIYALKRCGACYQDHKREEHYKKQKENPKPKKVYVLKRTPLGVSVKPIAKRSENGKKKQQNLNKWYREQWDAEMNSEGVCRCEECELPLRHYRAAYISHILSRKSHPELTFDVRNRNILCQGLGTPDCHGRWEGGDKKNMKIWKKNEALIVKLKATANSTN